MTATVVQGELCDAFSIPSCGTLATAATSAGISAIGNIFKPVDRGAGARSGSEGTPVRQQEPGQQAAFFPRQQEVVLPDGDPAGRSDRKSPARCAASAKRTPKVNVSRDRERNHR